MKRPEGRATKKAYPVMPYLIGLFVTVIVLVVLSYLVGLRNRDELRTYETPENHLMEYVDVSL